YLISKLKGFGFQPTPISDEEAELLKIKNRAEVDKKYSDEGTGLWHSIYHTLEGVSKLTTAFGREGTRWLSGVLGIPEVLFDTTSEFFGSDVTYKDVFGKDPIRTYLDKAVLRNEF